MSVSESSVAAEESKPDNPPVVAAPESVEVNVLAPKQPAEAGLPVAVQTAPGPVDPAGKAEAPATDLKPALLGLGPLRAIGENGTPKPAADRLRPRGKAPSPAAANLIARVRATAGPALSTVPAARPAPVSSSPTVPDDTAGAPDPVAVAVPEATAADLSAPAALPAVPVRLEPESEPLPARAPNVIDIRGLSLTFLTNDGPVEALSGIDLSVRRGEFVSLIGPSGCGKTTLLRVIADLERASAGTISVNGVSPEEARLARAYGYVFQAPALYPWRTVARNVGLPLEIMGLSRAERDRRVAANLALVNLAGFERKFPWQLSGGMQQRASIARALSVEPELLLMDEPFGALDEIVRDHLNEQLLQLWARTDKTVIFVTHSLPEAVFLSTRIVVMSPRPGRVHDVIESTLPRERTLDIRETPEFLKIAHRVRQGLRAGHSYDD